jgi:hypothetical protein
MYVSRTRISLQFFALMISSDALELSAKGHLSGLLLLVLRCQHREALKPQGTAHLPQYKHKIAYRSNQFSPTIITVQ